MTFIYAQKLDNLTFFLADTFTENLIQRTRYNWFVEPIAKTVNVRDDFVVAYAGMLSWPKKRSVPYLRTKNVTHVSCC